MNRFIPARQSTAGIRSLGGEKKGRGDRYEKEGKEKGGRERGREDEQWKVGEWVGGRESKHLQQSQHFCFYSLKTITCTFHPLFLPSF